MDIHGSILEYLGSVTVRSLALAAIALAATLVGRVRSAAARHAVCTAVVAGMLALAALAPLLPPLPLHILQAETGQIFEPQLPRLAINPTHTLTIPAPAAPSSRISRQFVAAAIYGVGVLAFLIRLLFGYLFTRRLVAASHAVEQPWADEVYESNWISVPMTVGWLRPKILLPAEWVKWEASKLDAVLAHERTHVRRADWAIAVVAGVNRCLFWFHPLAWWLEKRLALLAEQACDDSALLQVDTAPYAQALLDMAAAVKARQGRLVWEAMAMANAAEVRNRIERILDETRQIPHGLTRSRWLALAACSLPLIYVASVVQLAPAQQPELAPRKGMQTSSPSALGEFMKGKSQLDASDVARMEQHLLTNPHDLSVRAQLVIYYSDHGVREPRLSHIFWLIANHPNSQEAVFTSRGLTPRTSAYNDASDYSRAAGLWKQQAASHANDPRILANAADFLSQPGGDPDEAERLLMAARNVEPNSFEWSNRLARLYTVAIVGSAGDPQYRNAFPAFADRVKLQLESSTDGLLLHHTGRALAAVAVRPQPGQKLPDGILNLDEHPMLTPVVELGNRLIARAGQYGAGPTVVSGIVGSVAAGQPMPGTVVTMSDPRTTAAQALAQTQVWAPPLATPPALLQKIDPAYPPLARQARISGDVRLHVEVGTDGHVQRIEVVSGHPLMVPAAIEALKQYVFAPIPSPGSFQVTVPFRLDGSDGPLGVAGGISGGMNGGVPNGVYSSATGGVLGGIVGGVPGGVAGGVPTVVNGQPIQRIKIGGNIQAAKLISKVDPVYPPQARAAGIEGEVLLDVTIGDDGRVQSAVARDGNAVLATAAAGAVRQWVYQTTLLNGYPVGVITTVTVPFTLK